MGWVSGQGAVAGWVADLDGRVVGQALLRGATGTPLPAWENATGLPARRLGVVSRLFVAPDARRAGVGAALLAVAVAEARRRELLPVLDVLVRYRAAKRLYEAHGWTRIGELVWEMPDGSHEAAYAYAMLNG